MRSMRRTLVAGFWLGLVAFACSKASHADSVADFYRGKTVHIFVGASAGGGYDLVARLIASRIGAHIPGNPNVVVDNMPAASGLAMANYLYNSAPRDGTSLGVPTNAMALEPRLKMLTRAGGTASFDITKFNWLGDAARQPQVLFVWHTAGIKTAEDLKTTKIVVAALSVGSDSFILPTVINNMLGTKMQIVPGYEGHGDTFVAIERGEVQGYNDSFAGLIGNKPDWIRDKLVYIPIQFGRERLAALPDVPTAVELAPDLLDKEALLFYSTKYDLAYTLVATPDVPADRLAALRDAFDATMQDADYIDNAKKIELPVNPLRADAVTKIIDSVQVTPQNVIDRMRELMIAKKAD
ncbi:MAG TPA: tripartite tricarboxylate transporter substrate-binding protein [Beijerinckiaceae bacterium]|nr:tripartite tricarboxylate transporter substrate-binding protein [Beijerinckiaceae bacterium]